MKKKYVPLLLLLSSFVLVFSQGDGAIAPISILANDNTTISLFFPTPIAKVISPAVNYKFDYEEGTSMGFLQARKGNGSNLTVITNRGYIYSFALEFSEKVDNFNYILSPQHAMGKTNIAYSPIVSKKNEVSKAVEIKQAKIKNPVNTTENIVTNTDLEAVYDIASIDSAQMQTQNSEVPLEIKILGMEEGDLYDKDREEYYRIYCENNYLQRTIFKRIFRQNKRIVVKLNNILVDRDEIYLVMQLENNSKKEYKVNGLGFFLKKDDHKEQQLLTPLYTFNLQEVIDPESINEVVCVFKNFDLAPKEQFSVVLDEKEGDRMVLLPLDSKHINVPTN